MCCPFLGMTGSVSAALALYKKLCAFSHFLHSTAKTGECRKYEYIFNQKVIFTFGAGRLINNRLPHVDFVDKLNLLIATAKYIFKLSFFGFA